MPHCPSCGEEFSMKQKFCQNCGHNLSDFGEGILKDVYFEVYHVDENENEARKFIVTNENVVLIGDSTIQVKAREEINYDNVCKVKQISGKYSSYRTRETPELLTADYVTNGSASMSEGVELILVDGTHIAIYKRETLRNRKKWHDAPNPIKERGVIPEYPDPQFPEKIQNLVEDKITPCEIDSKYILSGPFDWEGCELRVEGWASGASEMNATMDASAEEKGKSRGLQLGPFIRSKSTSKSSIEGKISGEISDNTFTSKVKAFKIYEENLVIDSDIKLNLHFSEIDNIFEKGSGVVLIVGSTTFRIENVSNSGQIGEAVDFVKEQMDTFAEEETTTDDEGDSVYSAEKLRELKELQEDGILSDEEFQSKKEELLDDF